MTDVSSIPDDELLRRAVQGARSGTTRGWHRRHEAVMQVFSLGSTYAWQLCHRFGVDPDELVRR
jgi:hypothetical protein